MNQQEAIEKARGMSLPWIAMDDDGSWYGYTVKPQFSGGSWYRPDGKELERGTTHYLGAQDIIPTPEPIEVTP